MTFKAKFDHLLCRMQGNWSNRMETQNKYQWRNTDPRVERHIDLIRSATTCKQKASKALTLKEDWRLKLKEEHDANKKLFDNQN